MYSTELMHSRGSFYLAAHYERAAEMRSIRDELAHLGYQVTSRWIDQTEQDEALGEAELTARPHSGTRFALIDIDDIHAADTVVHFTGAGRGGRHTEFGIAIALHKALVIVGVRENVFHTLPEIEHYPDPAAFVLSLREDQWARR